MTFKEYTNPLYDKVENEDDWVSGLCCIMAHALQEKFDYPMYAVMIECNRSLTLIHAVVQLPNGIYLDAQAEKTADELWESFGEWSEKNWRDLGGFHETGYADQPLIKDIRPISLAQMWLLSPEDLDATNAAHDYINAHPEIFASLQKKLKKTH